MIQTNLLKHDDILIRIGWALAIVLTFGLPEALDKGTTAIYAGLALLGSAPLGLLVAGYRVRAREKRYVAIWRILDRAMEVRVPDLLASTGYSRDDVTETLAIVNRRGLGYYVWDTQRDVIVDGRLQTTMVVADRCPSCGASGAQSLTLGGGHAPACMQCGTAFPAELLNQLKLQAMKDLREAPPPPVAPMPQLNAKLLVVLSIVCWPMALIYYVRQTRVR